MARSIDLFSLGVRGGRPSPEAALVTALARGDIARVEQLAAGGLCWERVTELAERQQVAGLCSWVWRRRNASAGGRRSSALPARVEGELRNSYWQHLRSNGWLLHELSALQDSLASRGVDALFLKGPWLAFHAYPDPGARPVGDIDLLVRESDYAGAVEAITRVGYASSGRLPDRSAVALSHAHFEGQLRFGARNRRWIELHFRLVNIGPPSVSEGWVWDSARELVVGERRFRVPGPDAMLLHLLLHANQHRFAMLRLLYDVRCALDQDRSRVDETIFTERVRSLRCAASIYHGLVLAKELAGATPSAALLATLRPNRYRRLLFESTWGLAAARRLEAREGRTEAQAPRLYLLEMGRYRQKLEFLIRVAGAMSRRGASTLLGARRSASGDPPRGVTARDAGGSFGRK